MKIDRHKYLKSLTASLLSAQKHKIVKSKTWAKDFPPKPGVYIIRKKDKLIYVGETGSIKGRLKDLCSTRNHTARRSIGTEQFRKHAEYTKPSSKDRFCDTIEDLLNQYFAKNLTITFLEVDLGRKELEEIICKNHIPIHNIKTIRKS
ncbi:MAG TPA: GIY-YIG nuclease family protein [Ferruginibacter sp.]|jgi:hypothetical protein|nr:GIY-YIG nuclease family protein [Ferruginibacter sp.]